jgi:Holliday junction resolvasome RuvABC endonuclease subunit
MTPIKIIELQKLSYDKDGKLLMTEPISFKQEVENDEQLSLLRKKIEDILLMSTIETKKIEVYFRTIDDSSTVKVKQIESDLALEAVPAFESRKPKFKL